MLQTNVKDGAHMMGISLILMGVFAGPLAQTPADSGLPNRGRSPRKNTVGGNRAEVVPQSPSSLGGRADTKPTTPARSGSLLLVGGGMNLPDSIRQRFLELAGGQQARLIIIPSASARRNAAVRSFAFWKTAKVKSVRILHTTQRSQADDPHFFGQLRDVTGVWISGGDQSRLTALFGGTGVERELANVLKRGGVVGGTSAGASVVSAVMIAGTGKTGKGFGFLADTIIDQHFSNRGRRPRLMDLLRIHPGQCGIGIDEETAVVIQGREVSVLGNGTVTVASPDGPNASVRVFRAGSRFQQPTVLSVVSR
jgi:cyanophycinase